MPQQLAYAAPPPILIENARQPLTGANFHELVLESDLPVLVHCIAGWELPCRTQQAVIEKLALASDNRFVFATLDVQLEEALASLLMVRTLPTLLLYAYGRQIDRFSGFQSEVRLRSALVAAETPVTRRRRAT